MKSDGFYYELAGSDLSLTEEELKNALFKVLDSLGSRKKVFALPPDGTRAYARAGFLTKALYDYYGPHLDAVMPALGTHRPMQKTDFEQFFPGVPWELHRQHKWKKDLLELGRVPATYIEEQSEGKCSFDWPAQVNRQLVEGNHDLIVSIGQVVPHEVAGMANHSKNLFIGAGGIEAIAKSHWLGAQAGIETIMGKADNPVRAVLNYAYTEFASSLPILWVLTVTSPGEDGDIHTRGLFMGSDLKCFYRAAALSAQVNISRFTESINKVVVWLDPKEYRSTWLGNKAIYRTRKVIADGGELIIIAPGIDRFGEDSGIDRIIREFGYCGSEKVKTLVESGALSTELAAAAHLIHGSSEGRFSIFLAAGGLSQAEIESVGYLRSDPKALMSTYKPDILTEGWNENKNGPFYLIKKPGLGLWTI